MSESRFKHFGEMTWPDPRKIDELGWRLTHAPDSITREDQLVCASVISAYQQMVGDSRKKREYVCRELRKGAATGEGSKGE